MQDAKMQNVKFQDTELFSNDLKAKESKIGRCIKARYGMNSGHMGIQLSICHLRRA